jgi:hypothetical protein
MLALMFLLSLQASGTLVGKVSGSTVLDMGLGFSFPLPDVTVVLTHIDHRKERIVATSSSGTFVFQNLPLGTYTASARKEGYRVRGDNEAEVAVNVDRTHVVLPPFKLAPLPGNAADKLERPSRSP